MCVVNKGHTTYVNDLSPTYTALSTALPLTKACAFCGNKYIVKPEAVSVEEVFSGWGGVGIKEDHTHNGKDVGHREQQDRDEHHWLLNVRQREWKFSQRNELVTITT